MVTAEHVQTMARYGEWVNDKLLRAAGSLSDADRQQDRGAFWGSIHGTLCHILWADRWWVFRLVGAPSPPAVPLKESPTLCADFATLESERRQFDRVIRDWAGTVTPGWLSGELRYFSPTIGRELVRPIGLLVTHLFNHQTHHRGQVHCLLTQAGVDPGDIDLPFMLND